MALRCLNTGQSSDEEHCLKKKTIQLHQINCSTFSQAKKRKVNPFFWCRYPRGILLHPQKIYKRVERGYKCNKIRVQLVSGELFCSGKMHSRTMLQDRNYYDGRALNFVWNKRDKLKGIDEPPSVVE